MSGHPVDAATIADLGIDYLVDRTAADRAEHGFDEPEDPRAAEVRVRARLEAAAQLAQDAGWRAELGALAGAGAGPARRAALAAMVLRRAGARRFDPAQPLAAQLHPDEQAVLDVLAIERRAGAAARGGWGVTLAAPLRPREAVPPRGPSRPGALEVVEIGDLGDPFSCQAHTQVHEELGSLREAVRWRWLYCATSRSLLLSHRAGAVAEQVLAHAPHGFWPVVGTLADRGLADGSEHARSVLAAAGVDPELGRPPDDGTPHTVAMVRSCCSPCSRSAVGWSPAPTPPGS